MAPSGQLVKDKQHFLVVIVAYGGPRLEGS